MMDGDDLFEIMSTTRSMRRLKPDAVPDALISRVLEAGTWAASGGNGQAWRFLVIRDQQRKEAAAVWYRKGWHETVGPRYRSGEPAPGMDRAVLGRPEGVWRLDLPGGAEHAACRAGVGVRGDTHYSLPLA